jgi:hypothetical protein
MDAAGNVHFITAESWKSAEAMLTFQPRVPRHTAGLPLQTLRIHVRDHKRRELPLGARSLEAHYGRFSLSQARKTEDEARRLVVGVSYGPDPREARITGREARVYELGPEPQPDDIDGRRPAVVVWHDAGMFFLVASSEMACDELIGIATSLYPPRA